MAQESIEARRVCIASETDCRWWSTLDCVGFPWWTRLEASSETFRSLREPVDFRVE